MKVGNIKTSDISVVVQGALNVKYISMVLQGIRRFLSGAEIILSTWKNSDLRILNGLDYDILIESEDPGAEILYRGTDVTHNLNRQIVSSINGIKAANRKYVLKTRTDVLLRGNGFLKYFDKFPDKNSNYKLLKERVVVCQYYCRKADDFPFHPSDWSFFGLKEDVENIFDIPLAKEPETTQWFYGHSLTEFHKKSNYKFNYFRHRYCAEQYIWSQFLKKHIDFEFEHMFDIKPENTYLTEVTFANNLIIIPYTRYKLRFLKYSPAEDYPCYDYFEWLQLYKKYCNPNYKIPLKEQLISSKKLKKCFGIFKTNVRNGLEPFLIFGNWIKTCCRALFYFFKMVFFFTLKFLELFISFVFSKHKEKNFLEVKAFNCSIFFKGVNFKTGRKELRILGINFAFNKINSFFKKVLKDLPKDVRDIYIIRQSTGESYILANIAMEWCRINKSEKPFFVFTRPYHFDLFKMFADSDFKYDSKYMKIPPSDFPYFDKMHYVYKDKNIYVYMDQKFLFDLIENSIYKGENQFVKGIAEHLCIENYEHLFKNPRISDESKVFAEKYINENSLAQQKYVVLFEKSYTVQSPDCVFWNNLKHKLNEMDIKYIVNNEKLTLEQTIALCEHADAIIGARTGVVEYLTSLKKEMHIVYGYVPRFNLNPEKAIKTYSLKDYPNVNAQKIFEYEYDGLSGRKIISEIIAKLTMVAKNEVTQN